MNDYNNILDKEEIELFEIQSEVKTIIISLEKLEKRIKIIRQSIEAKKILIESYKIKQ